MEKGKKKKPLYYCSTCGKHAHLLILEEELIFLKELAVVIVIIQMNKKIIIGNIIAQG